MVCHRNFGVGSDGILWGPLPSAQGDFGLRIFNPDGSEAEKSGNGLRIFSRYLWDQRPRRAPPFTIETPGGVVTSEIKEKGGLITVAMGTVSFDSAKIPVAGAAPRGPRANRSRSGGRTFTFSRGDDRQSALRHPAPTTSRPELARRYGPDIEVHPNFPRKTNVQFLKVIDRANDPDRDLGARRGLHPRLGQQLERGGGGRPPAGPRRPRRSPCACPAATIGIEIGDGFSITMTGTVNKVADGAMDPELFAVAV